MCVCVRGALQAPLDLLLLVYKRVQSVKLLLLRVRQSLAKVENETFASQWLCGCLPDLFDYGHGIDLLENKKKEKREKKRVLLTIEKKPTCTVNFSMTVSK